MGAASPGKMTGSTSNSGREHGTATPAGTGTMQEYRDAQLARRNIRLPHDRAAARAPQAPAENTVLPPLPEPAQCRNTGMPAARRNGTGTMQEYRDARCPPKCPVAARPRRQRTYRTPDQVHREVQNTAIRVAGVKIFYSERPAVMPANTSRYAAGAGCRFILFRFRPLNKQLNWLPFPSILR